MKKKTKKEFRRSVQFPRGIRRLNIPFMPDIGSYDQLSREMNRFEIPKGARRMSAEIVVSIDLKVGQTSYQMAQVYFEK